MILGGLEIANAFELKDWKAFRVTSEIPFDELKKLIGPNSIDVTLSDYLLIPEKTDEPLDPRIDSRKISFGEYITIPEEGFLLGSGEFVLGCVRERFECSETLHFFERDVAKFVPMYEGRSTFARIGLGSHITAGFGDYGFSGAFTLELTNFSARPILLFPKMRIGQVYFMEVAGPSVYQGSYSSPMHWMYPHPPMLGEDRIF